MDLLYIIASILVSFLIVVMTAPIIIPFLRRLKFGQSIREEGPKSHHKKTGTPTMGGVMIIVSVVLGSLILHRFVLGTFFSREWLLLMVVFIGFGALGFIDDFIKVVLKRNLGLTSIQKLIGQLVVSVLFYLLLLGTDIDTALQLPGTDMSFDLGFLYPVFVVVLLVGASNAVNLTDGLDGLVGGLGAISFLTFGSIAVLTTNESVIALISFSVAGGLLGFLVFNVHPAKVFMGDTGSLALGGLLGAIGLMLKLEILLVLIGFVFVIETLSVMIQVISFKTRGKRVFLMSPIHHHFELKGWSEWRVVTTFWLVGLLSSVLSILIQVVL
ncbi:phospho-N-acetylmuramoyl-pentapeptide-transferase [Halolactibacillus halophilus]|uniref:Phospho-N-acetylmuramoyl-pentapeptide-transferase n=1 Tax=Halolactibacillus halophilus TaxID=306540 RepID=A0A1I5LRR1_9BACI|nr:phospho-N-acetylmuramoyl-pentapeptide-transferase [Halolactibacillus halophilus]GEM00690.1 phospho-N-acetylmuramoyl-pentapeptide-transferase [Halolactibacillus halophilus]SFO99857.1 phospho-N-acetylmuramoyl-pentapeptide-transferase [Halolactibacillus halophilus]